MVTSSVDEKLSVTADSGMSRNVEMRPRAGAGARSPECGSGSGDGTRESMTGRRLRQHYGAMRCPEPDSASLLLPRPVVI